MNEQTANRPTTKRENRKGSRFPIVVPVEAKWQELSAKTVKEAPQAKEVNAQGGVLDPKTDAADLAAHDVTQETAGIEEFFPAIESLHQRVADPFKGA